MGGPIPWTAIDQYCDRHDIVGDMFTAMEHHIRALDVAFCEHQAEERKNKK